MTRRVIGPLMAMLIGVIAVYAFYPRSLPHFPATETSPTRLRVNGIAMIGERLIAVGESGHILISDGAAEHWRGARIQPGTGIARLDATLKFLADMSILLSFMSLVNVFGAIFLLPALAAWLLPERGFSMKAREDATVISEVAAISH